MTENIEVILVDVGNSSIKTTEVVAGSFGDQEIFDSIHQVFESYTGLPMMISSVRKTDEGIVTPNRVVVLDHQTKLPITLDYLTPETLGADRIAAAVGANDLFPNQNNVIIDLGTCMTIDLVDSSGTFKGGVIAPGMKMRMKSMASFTSALPDISEDEISRDSGILGKTTQECLWSGSFWGIYHEINGVIRTLEADFTSLNIIVTGGDAHYFESNLKAHIFAGSKIVQRGLYRIWKHQ